MLEKPNREQVVPYDPLDVEYRELMKLAGPDGCKCGIPGCPGHEVKRDAKGEHIEFSAS